MRKINFFDTTLRDGEQSPGVNLNTQEKLAIAKQLERLGADIIEAGFPASSRGDFLAVQEIARTIKNCSVTGLARCVKGDIDACLGSVKGWRSTKNSCIYRHIGHSFEAQAENDT